MSRCQLINTYWWPPTCLSQMQWAYSIAMPFSFKVGLCREIRLSGSKQLEDRKAWCELGWLQLHAWTTHLCLSETADSFSLEANRDGSFPLGIPLFLIIFGHKALTPQLVPTIILKCWIESSMFLFVMSTWCTSSFCSPSLWVSRALI